MIQIYDVGAEAKVDIALLTDCDDEREFFRELAIAIDCGISNVFDEGGSPGCATPFAREQLEQILSRAMEIACKLRGYKNGVKERRLILAGDAWPNTEAEVLNGSAYDATEPPG